jgi:hypothetical protein
MKRYPVDVKIVNNKCPECQSELQEEYDGMYHCPVGNCYFHYGQNHQGKECLLQAGNHKQDPKSMPLKRVLLQGRIRNRKDVSISISYRKIVANKDCSWAKPRITFLSLLNVACKGKSVALPISSKVAKTLIAVGVAKVANSY